MSNSNHDPYSFRGVMVSSTFSDLEEHRAALIHLIDSQGLEAIAMENDGAKLMDVIDSSLKMVRESAAYIGVISHKYGQVPECPKRNPDNLSITELEFNEALRLKYPILLFVIGEAHPVLVKDVEMDPEKRKKLEAFRERAKNMNENSAVHRVYATFNSLDHFKEQIGKSISAISEYLKERNPESGRPRAEPLAISTIPQAPAFYAAPSYIGTHQFIGREDQLNVLNDWVRPADSHVILLFESIGGNGKSMLTWEWATKHATKAREDWAGIFWYSFYEKGAIMDDFCQRALAYMTGWPLSEFKEKRRADLKELLLYQLREKPWLFILDGLERVLVAYHRIDAAAVPEEELYMPTDKIVNRDPCICIYDEDDELLQALSQVAPSKILISSRLVPKVLFNTAHQALPGVLRVPLLGLRPIDAEKMFHNCGVKGDSALIQDYLASQCDCHPLTIGVLAGLVNNYLPDKGNFDAWHIDPADGGQFNLANLDLIQKRNHILKVALHALPEKSRQLLSTLALLSEALDYKTLATFNPHLPPELEVVQKPSKPGGNPEKLSTVQKVIRQELYEKKLKEWEAYQLKAEARIQSVEFRNASKELEQTVLDLSRRGLLQRDPNTSRYDLHPVVRGIVAGALDAEDKEYYGQRVLDYLFKQVDVHKGPVEGLEGTTVGHNIVRILLNMGRYQEAINMLRNHLGKVLLSNLEAYKEILELIRPCFSNNWLILPIDLDIQNRAYLVHTAILVLMSIGMVKESLVVNNQYIQYALLSSDLNELRSALYSITVVLGTGNQLRAQKRVLDLLYLLVDVNNEVELFTYRLHLFSFLRLTGKWDEAKETWRLLSTREKWKRLDEIEVSDPSFEENESQNEEQALLLAESVAKERGNRNAIRNLYRSRGIRYMKQGEWKQAILKLSESVNMARSVRYPDAIAETYLSLVKFKCGQLTDPIGEIARLAELAEPAHCALSEFWLALGNEDEAKKHALQAYQEAWADGTPYVNHYTLHNASELLTSLGVEKPDLPPYDPTKEEKFPWEDRVIAFVEKLKAEKERKETEEEE